MKIDKRKKYYLMVDTETCPIDNTIQDVNPDNMLVYDIGGAICDKHGNIYETFSFIVRDIFFGEREKMKSAYYADKIPQYEEDIKTGKRKVATFTNIKFYIENLMTKYNTNIMIAHNARFDLFALNATQKYISQDKYKYFFKYGVEIWDTLKMVRQTVGKQKSYKNFCFENGFVTKHKKPQPQLKAETLYKYHSGDYDFEEEHKGLGDVLIEVAIFAWCMSQHKKMTKALFA